jgi:rSAM/selenodomain-associated transferase 2
MSDKISIIIPTLNDANTLEATLRALQALRERGHEVIAVDGGSRDGTVSIARKYADRVLMSGPGRALQMNTGADSSAHPVLLFLHADTFLPGDADHLIHAALHPQSSIWGRFDIRFDSDAKAFRALERFINLGTSITGNATGDQPIFITKRFFERAGCYDDFPLLENVALGKKLHRFGRAQSTRAPAVISSREWQANGILQTLVRKWRIRAAYFFGVHPDVIAQRYCNDQRNKDLG